MVELRKDLPELPDGMKARPLDRRGYPVPWFVGYVDGEPDFRCIREGGIVEAHTRGICWLCGQRLGRYRVFVIGPMSAVNRVSSEPPSHRDCAEFAAKACPFLVRPTAQRREAGLEELGAHDPAGCMIKRNPGVVALWVCRGYRVFPADNGFLFQVGEPCEILWYREGRPATQAEIMESIDSGLPILQEAAEKDGPPAVSQLLQQLGIARALVAQTAFEGESPAPRDPRDAEGERARTTGPALFFEIEPL